MWVRDIELTQDQRDVLKIVSVGGKAVTKAQVNREKHRAKRLTYQEAGRAKAKEGRPLHLAGCMLYWAEGAKSKKEVFFVNSDGNMLRLFMRFLREEMRVDDSDISLVLYCYSDDEQEKSRIGQYWIDLLGLPPSCRAKALSRPGNETRRNRLPNGICGIRVFSTELAQHIFGAIQEYGGFEKPEWLF
jgi:hypothetical protein